MQLQIQDLNYEFIHPKDFQKNFETPKRKKKILLTIDEYFYCTFYFRKAQQVREMENELEMAKEEAKNIEDIQNTMPSVCLKSSEQHCLEDQC